MPQPSSDLPRRFYKTATVREGEGGFAVLLDGRLARTPQGAPLSVPVRALADLLADEWNAQGDHVDPAAMPATRMACTAIDRTGGHAAAVAGEVARYAGSDVLCYFAEGPQAVLEAEVTHWTPVLDWARAELGLEFVRTTGVVHRAQPSETLARVEALAAALDPFALTGLAFAAALFGSAVLAFAVQRGELTGEAAFELSRLDEALQIANWGEDAEAAARTAVHRAEAAMVGRWLAALASAVA